jgi:hypothetical protein
MQTDRPVQHFDLVSVGIDNEEWPAAGFVDTKIRS